MIVMTSHAASHEEKQFEEIEHFKQGVIIKQEEELQLYQDMMRGEQEATLRGGADSLQMHEYYTKNLVIVCLMHTYISSRLKAREPNDLDKLFAKFLNSVNVESPDEWAEKRMNTLLDSCIETCKNFTPDEAGNRLSSIEHTVASLTFLLASMHNLMQPPYYNEFPMAEELSKKLEITFDSVIVKIPNTSYDVLTKKVLARECEGTPWNEHPTADKDTNQIIKYTVSHNKTVIEFIRQYSDLFKKEEIKK
jgi:hypothetical protein